MSTLRGAHVEVDVRLATRVVLGACLLALAIASALLFVTGVSKNSQLSELHQHGKPVVMTVASCVGLLGGSGSNPVGYACRGTFTLDGQRYDEAIPGDGFRALGSRLPAIASPNDPGLVTLPGLLAHEHASPRVFIVPAALAAVLAVSLGVIVIRRRSTPRRLRAP